MQTPAFPIQKSQSILSREAAVDYFLAKNLKARDNGKLPYSLPPNFFHMAKKFGFLKIYRVI